MAEHEGVSGRATSAAKSRRMSARETGQRVLIAGSFGHGNIGDEAILLALVRGLRQRRPDLGVAVVAGDGGRVRALVDVETVEWTDWSGIISTLRRADLLIEGGGGLFFDRGGFDASRLVAPGASDLHHYASFPLLAQLLRKPLALLACGAEPLASPTTRDIVRACFEASVLASVRDDESLAALSALGVARDRIRVTADLAFSLPMPGPDECREALASIGLAHDRPVIALVPLRPGVGAASEEQLRTVGRHVSELARSGGCRILLLLCHPSWDDPAAALLRTCLPPDLCREATIESPKEFAATLARCELVVSMRLHAVILAALGNTPAVTVGSAPKLASVGAQLGLGATHVAPSELERFPEVLHQAWATRHSLRATVAARLPEIRRRSEENFSLACNLLDSPPPIPDTLGDFAGALVAMIERRLGSEHGQPGDPTPAHGVVDALPVDDVEPTRISVTDSVAGPERELEHARVTIASLERERDDLRQRLERLESTKAVRLARMYWLLRAKLRGKPSE